MSLIQQYNSIDSVSQNETYQFSAAPIKGFESHRIAKDKFNNPVLLLSVNPKTRNVITPNVKLKNVTVLFHVKCKVLQRQELVDQKFTVLSFVGVDQSLKTYFLRLCSTLLENLGNDPSQENVRKEILRFVELFRFALEPQMKSVQGLWAELFLIAESRRPDNLIRYWRSIPGEKFDFNGGEERIEVKSTGTDERIHMFSLEQLTPPPKTEAIIASVFVKISGGGTDVFTLQNQIIERMSGDIELIEKLQTQIAMTLGESISESDKFKFDYQIAKDSIQFYKSANIPQINLADVPKFVSEIRFKADLCNTTPVTKDQLPKNGLLFESLGS